MNIRHKKRKANFRLVLGMFSLMLLLHHPFTASTQTLNTRETEEISYRLFVEQKWDSLIAFNRKAIQSGHDYFYLQLRSGLAWYNKGNYRKAATSFESALNFNSTDTYTIAYLYWCYVYSGRTADANYIIHQLNPETRKGMKLPSPGLLESITLEAGPSQSDNLKLQKDQSVIGPGGVYGERKLYDKSIYEHLGLKLRLTKSISFYQGFSHMDIGFQQQIQFNTGDSVNTLKDTTTSYKFNQNEYYCKAEIRVGKGWVVSPVFHYISSQGSNLGLSFQWDTTWYWANPGFDTLQSLRYTYAYQYPKISQNFSNYVASLAVSKDLNLFKLMAFGSISNLNNLKQSIMGVSCTYYPFGNLNLYTTAEFSSFRSRSQKVNPGNTGFINKTDRNIIYKQLIGTKVLSFLWLEAGMSWGELTNYSDNSAFVAYNIPDRILSREELSLLIPIKDYAMITLRYIHSSKQSQILQYTDNEHFTIINRAYTNQSIIGGIQWKF